MFFATTFDGACRYDRHGIR